jgi:tripartite-type tricarboxylate transporter receptor subunit TctC
LIEYVKANPGKLNYATNGVGTSAHFTSELFNLQAGTKLVHIPYRSSGEIITGLRNGDVHVAFANAPAVNALVQAGTLRAIAVTSSIRTKALPNVPTMVESGMTEFVVTSWLGAYAPTGTPPDVVKKIGDAIVKGGMMPENVQRLESAGFQVSVKDAATYAEFNRTELARWKEVARRANIQPES